jgi:hypothetical protein
LFLGWYFWSFVMVVRPLVILWILGLLYWAGDGLVPYGNDNDLDRYFNDLYYYGYLWNGYMCLLWWAYICELHWQIILWLSFFLIVSRISHA